MKTNSRLWEVTLMPGFRLIFPAQAGSILIPLAGVVGNHNLIRVATVRHPSYAIPLQGTWYGNASDGLGMQVAVSVKAVNL